MKRADTRYGISSPRRARAIKIDVPFEEIPAPAFEMTMAWTFEHLLGDLATWSPRKKYIERYGGDPVEIVLPRLRTAWGDVAERTPAWPLSLRAFRV